MTPSCAEHGTVPFSQLSNTVCSEKEMCDALTELNREA